MDIQGMLTWLNALCEDAAAAANAGDVTKANQLGRHPAMRDYFNNVHMLHTVEAVHFVQYYPDKAKELHALYEAYQESAAQAQQITQQADKIAALEHKLDAMMERVAAFMESQTPDSEPEPEPESPKPRRAKKADTTEGEKGDDAPADTAAEGEPAEAE